MFYDIIGETVEGYEPECQLVESLCFNCHKNGETRILLTKIKFFNEILVSSFSCDHCGHSNKSVQPLKNIKDKGQKIELEVITDKDLNRRVVRPAHSVIDLEDYGKFPSKEGSISTIEGLIREIVENIEACQEERRISSPELAVKLDEFIHKVEVLLTLEKPFKFILDDPSGNGCIENYLAPKEDPQMKTSTYSRSNEQNELLGYSSNNQDLQVINESEEADEEESEKDETEEEESTKDETEEDESTKDETEEDENIAPDEVLQFKSACPNCSADCHINMKPVEIPHFKQIIIMALVCDRCGYRENEVKSGGGIEEKGRRYELCITEESDLKRDVLKSETCGVKIPEIGFEATYGTLASKFTTLEGLLVSFYENLSEKNPFATGDSVMSEELKEFGQVIQKLNKIAKGETMNVLIILDDPAGNSYLQNYYAPDEDPQMKVIDYERSEEQNDIIGVSGMNTKDFETIS